MWNKELNWIAVHSRVVKNKKINVCGQTTHVWTSSITYGMMELIASPRSWSWVKVLSITWCPVCCRDMFHKDLFTATESAAPCQPREKWCTTQKQREVIFDLPRQLPPKVRDMTASNNSPPHGPKGWTCPCGCPRGSNKSNWTVHQWHFRKSEASFPV